jgi:hypothetical protein
VVLEALTVKRRCEQPAPIAMPTAVKPKHRPGPEPIAEIRLHVDQLVGARRTHRPHQSRVRNHDGSTEEWDVDFEDVSVPLDPIPHRAAAKYSEQNTLHELG